MLVILEAQNIIITLLVYRVVIMFHSYVGYNKLAESKFLEDHLTPGRPRMMFVRLQWMRGHQGTGISLRFGKGILRPLVGPRDGLVKELLDMMIVYEHMIRID